MRSRVTECGVEGVDLVGYGLPTEGAEIRVTRAAGRPVPAADELLTHYA